MKNKFIDFCLYKCGINESSDLGIGWNKCRETPFATIPKPDKPYYNYLHIKFKFIYYWLCVDIYYKKMPYRNKAEYKQWKQKK
jgi:hypothetical protein